jgi:hypothetical protein
MEGRQRDACEARGELVRVSGGGVHVEREALVGCVAGRQHMSGRTRRSWTRAKRSLRDKTMQMGEQNRQEENMS